MLETIREYAGERLRASGDLEATERRHAEHFLALRRLREPLARHAGRAALRPRHLGGGQPPRCSRVGAGRTTRSSSGWSSRSRSTTSGSRTTRKRGHGGLPACSTRRRASPPRCGCEPRWATATRAGRSTRARRRRLYRDALALARELGDERAVATMSLSWSLIAIEDGDYDECERLMDESRAAHERTRSPAVEVMRLETTGRLARTPRRRSRARARADRPGPRRGPRRRPRILGGARRRSCSRVSSVMRGGSTSRSRMSATRSAPPPNP